ncbi:hypothetical protein B0H10DRAFT_2240420 [Mycena sp. CBHHK59/15]|nr:hypothetical protein B0H10DRAFT_2240420 [Mycena sp. CBHHK59/15]
MPALYSKRSTRLLSLSRKLHQMTLRLLHRFARCLSSPRTPLPAHDPDSTALSLACPLDDLLSGRVARTSANAPFIGLRQLLLCINKFSSPSAPTPCLAHVRRPPAILRPPRVPHAPSSSPFAIANRSKRCAAAEARMPHALSTRQEVRIRKVLQHEAELEAALKKARCRCVPPCFTAAHTGSRTAPTYTTASHLWPPDARVRHVKPESTRLHSCRTAHPGAPACACTWRTGVIGRRVLRPVSLRGRGRRGARAGFRTALTKKFVMFFAIAVFVVPEYADRGHIDASRAPRLLLVVNQVCLRTFAVPS